MNLCFTESRFGWIMSLERLPSPCLPPPRGINGYWPIEIRGGGEGMG